MNQYSVLMVDDEEEVFQVIMKKLDWEAMGFRIAGYAKNGVEALEMAEELQVDVVMTDIKMPYMDGLTLCKKLKEQYPKIKVIIFSGFDEFEYAKEAIKIEAEEYILKPINSNELREVFVRIKGNLDRELNEKRNIERLHAYYLESLPVLQESFYASLLDGRIPEERIMDLAANYQIDLSGPFFAVTILHISKSDVSDEDTTMDPFLLTLSVRELAKEQLEGQWDSKMVSYLGDTVVITRFSDKAAVTHFTDDLDRLCKMAKRICGAKVTAGIGPVVERPEQLQLSYLGARNAVSYRAIYGNTRAINICEIDPMEHTDMPWEEPYIQNILKKIKMGDEQALREAIREFTEQLSATRMSLQKYQILMMELVSEIYRFGIDNRINMEQILGEEGDPYGRALLAESPEELRTFLEERCIQMQRQVLHERRNSTKSYVTKAIEYVKEHYGDQELSIETICSYLNVSATYFSTVFKKETGKTFINYLTEYRMQQAVDMLLTQNEKTYMIAEKVGYADPNYFSYAFKKQFGVSPSKYKNQYQEQH